MTAPVRPAASPVTALPAAPGPSGRRLDVGLVAAVLTAAAFGTSGPFAKSLLETGWSSGAIVLLRVGIAALVLLPLAVVSLRGRWRAVRRHVGLILSYGLVAVAGCQVAYFNAVQHLPVGVALLLEYCGTVLVVLWVWARTRRSPGRTTWTGIAVCVVGLALVLDVAGHLRPDPVGVFWGLVAAVGLAVFFVGSASEADDLPPVALAALGMAVGAVALALLGLVKVLPMTFATHDVVLRGTSWPWWLAIGELAVIAAATAYLLGTFAARRLGSTVASFVGLAEVLFAVLFAWLLLGELPRPLQLVGGLLVVGGVVAVRAGELRRP